MADHWQEERKTALNNDRDTASKKAQEYLDWINNVPLTIAITGESGSGKSTLVNALRGLKNKAEGAAPTGAVETTTEPTEYQHPQNPNIRIWDLPGIGTTTFTADKYMQHVKFEKYDFFIIVSSDRFRENDAKLAQEITKINKKFYFVRSKIDQSIQGEKACDPDFNEEALVKTIKDCCIKALMDLGIESPKVFLVSGLCLHLYEFEKLWKTLGEDLPQHQRDVLLLALPVINVDILEQKKKALGDKIKWYTLASSAGAAVPVPGFSESLDLSMIVKFVIECRRALCLNPDSLQKLSTFSRVPVEELKAEIKSLLASNEVTKNLVFKVLSASVPFVTAALAEEGARFVPVFGTAVAMSLSSFSTYKALNYVLDSLTEDAVQVFTKARQVNTSK